MRWLVVAAAFSAITSCAQRQGTETRRIAPNLAIRISSSARTCDRAIDPALQRILRRETPQVVTAACLLGACPPEPTSDPSSDDLKAAAAPAGRAAIVLIHSGHGRLMDRQTKRVLSDDEALLADPGSVQSVLCLRDGPTPIEDIALAFGQPTTSALFITNACYSAHVDVRHAKTELSLISGSTRLVATSSGRTPLGRALIDALGGALDRDGDASASDAEIFAALDRQFARTFGEPDPKLRRQLWTDPRFFRSAAAVDEYPIPALGAPPDPPVTRAGHRYLRFPGRVAEPFARATGLTPEAPAVPCPQAIGQCFQLGG
jgi:hypothetical protein